MRQPGKWWINGSLFDPNEAVLPVTDHGLTVGDGCFETMKIVEGEPFALTRHLTRLRRSLDALRLHLSVDDDELRAAVRLVVDSAPGAGIVRITITAGRGPLGSGRGNGPPTTIVAAGAVVERPAEARVITVPWPRNERGALAGVKSTSYAENVLALAEATERGASEAIFANTKGRLCEGTGSNIFIEFDGRMVTPPLSSGCLAGITRELVLENTDAEEADLPIDQLGVTREAFLTSSTRDVMAVTRIDARSLVAGPLTTEAAAVFRAVVAATTDP